MKKFLLLITGFAFSLTMIAQGSSTVKEKGKDKSKKEKSLTPKNSEQIGIEKKIKAEHSKKNLGRHFQWWQWSEAIDKSTGKS